MNPPGLGSQASLIMEQREKLLRNDISRQEIRENPQLRHRTSFRQSYFQPGAGELLVSFPASIEVVRFTRANDVGRLISPGWLRDVRGCLKSGLRCVRDPIRIVRGGTGFRDQS